MKKITILLSLLLLSLNAFSYTEISCTERDNSKNKVIIKANGYDVIGINIQNETNKEFKEYDVDLYAWIEFDSIYNIVDRVDKDFLTVREYVLQGKGGLVVLDRKGYECDKF